MFKRLLNYTTSHWLIIYKWFKVWKQKLTTIKANDDFVNK
jgi:hypothetical protein